MDHSIYVVRFVPLKENYFSLLIMKSLYKSLFICVHKLEKERVFDKIFLKNVSDDFLLTKDGKILTNYQLNLIISSFSIISIQSVTCGLNGFTGRVGGWG